MMATEQKGILQKREEYYNELRRLSQPDEDLIPKTEIEDYTRIMAAIRDGSIPSKVDISEEEAKGLYKLGYVAFVGVPLLRTLQYYNQQAPVVLDEPVELSGILFGRSLQILDSRELFDFLTTSKDSHFLQSWFKALIDNPSTLLRLNEAFSNNDFVAFDRILADTNCLSKPANQCIGFLKTVYDLLEEALRGENLSESQKDILRYELDGLIKLNEDSPEAKKAGPVLCQCILLMKDLLLKGMDMLTTDVPAESGLDSITPLYDFCYGIHKLILLLDCLGELTWNKIEREIFDGLLMHPLFPNSYEEIKKVADSLQAGRKKDVTAPTSPSETHVPEEKAQDQNDCPTFSLPRGDEWKKCPTYKIADKQHYEKTVLGRSRAVAPEQVESLYNALVKVECIDNDENVLFALAVRLTGRKLMKEPIPLIEWKGENAELDYLIFRLTPEKQKPDYAISRNFFDGYDHRGAARRAIAGKVRPSIINKLDEILPPKVRPKY